MAKRTKKRIPRYDKKSQTGCIWTFISIFDYRSGRSTKRLLSDNGRHHHPGRQQQQQQNVGNGDFKTKLEMLTNSIGELQPVRKCDEKEGKLSVKELMEKEMFKEDDQNKLTSSDNERVHKRSRTRSWSSFGSKSFTSHDEKQSNSSLYLDVVINDICSRIHQERFINDLDSNSDNLDEAIKTFVTDQIINGNPIRKRRSQSLEEILLKEDRSVGTQFSLTEIKRRLKHAMTGEKIEKSWTSKKISCNYNEKYAMPSIEKLKEERINDIYIKARTHLSKIVLRNGEESEHCSSSRRSLGLVLETVEDMKNESLSTFDDLIYSVSSEQNLENHKDDEEECEALDNSETPSCILEVGFESNCQMGSLNLEEEELLVLPSPLSSPDNKNNEYAETSNDRSERPSPVSVLESVFSEDDIIPSSTRTIKSSGDGLLQPRQIQFEELSNSYREICIRTNQDEEESSFEYVEAVLLASDLKWDDFLLRWTCSVPILDHSLFQEVELFSSRSMHDQKLLFDCTNEVLEEVCSRYFSYSPRVSSLKLNIRPVPTGKELIEEIWEGVEWNLLQFSPCVLENTVEKDMMEKADRNHWMNLRFEREGISAEIGEEIMEELLKDLTRNFNEKTIV